MSSVILSRGRWVLLHHTEIEATSTGTDHSASAEHIGGRSVRTEDELTSSVLPVEDHFDLLFEGTANLLAFAIAEPFPWKDNAALRLPDHRTIYLDYEGPISGNRGRVRQVAKGTYEQVEMPDEVSSAKKSLFRSDQAVGTDAGFTVLLSWPTKGYRLQVQQSRGAQWRVDGPSPEGF